MALHAASVAALWTPCSPSHAEISPPCRSRKIVIAELCHVPIEVQPPPMARLHAASASPSTILAAPLLPTIHTSAASACHAIEP
nr:hypothetical protein [Sphingopyxis sp. EG6]